MTAEQYLLNTQVLGLFQCLVSMTANDQVVLEGTFASLNSPGPGRKGDNTADVQRKGYFHLSPELCIPGWNIKARCWEHEVSLQSVLCCWSSKVVKSYTCLCHWIFILVLQSFPATLSSFQGNMDYPCWSSAPSEFLCSKQTLLSQQ